MLARSRHWLRAIFRRERVEADLEEELRYHLDREVERHIANGMTPEEARFLAAREFGNVESLKEQSRNARATRPWEDFIGDLRYAGRALRRSPGFAAVSVATLALAIGGSTAIFALVDAVLLKTLPVEKPAELVFLEVTGSGGGFGAPPYPMLERIRDESRSFAGLAAFTAGPLAISIDGRPERVSAQLVSGSYFDLLGVRAVLGRTLTPSDEQLDPPAAVISHSYWQRRFGGRRDVLGQTIGYGDWRLSVVGVTPPGFTGLDVAHPVDVTIPLTVESEQLRNPDLWWLTAVARRGPGVPDAAAIAEADGLFRQMLAETGSSADDDRHLALVPAGRGVSGFRTQYGRPLLLLMGLVLSVLLIACINIASLMLARSAGRRREFAVRVAIGAPRLRLIRLLLAESLLLSILGTAAGLIVGIGGAQAIAAFFAVGRNPVMLEVGVTARVLLFAVALCLATSVLFGLAPAVQASQSVPSRDLRGESARRRRLGWGASPGRVLVMLQVVLSLVLVLCAGLFVRSLGALYAVDLGFTPGGVVTLSVEQSDDAYTEERLRRLWPTLLERIEAVPGVHSASLSVLTPLSGRDRGRRIELPGFQPVLESDLQVHLNYVSPEYFETFGTPVRSGRTFSTLDGPEGARVVLLNRSAARFYFGDRDPLGSRVAMSLNDRRELYEIVGVVEDAKHNDLREPAPRFLYFPLNQSSERQERLTLAVRSDVDRATLLGALTREIGALDPSLLVSEVATAEQQINHSIVRERLVALLASVFGTLGLILAALGLFGVVSHGVTRRTREIGVRMALGAPAARVRWEVMREGLMIVCIGVVIGLPVSLVALRAVAGMLYGVGPNDPSTALASVAVLVSVAAVAAFLPARRASHTDPMKALRWE